MPNARTAKSTREKAEALRKEAERQAARRRTFIAAGLVVVAIVVAIGVVLFAKSLPTHSATPRNLVDGGILIGNKDAKVTVEVYEDFQCPICQQFEQASGQALTDLTKDGKVRLIYRPVAILDRMSSTAYSTRSFNLAMAAVDLDPSKFPALHTSLFQNQPPENGAGLPDSKLVELAVAAGLDKAAIEKQVKEQPYRDLAAKASDDLSKRFPPGGTPTVAVNGTKIENATPENIQAAVTKALG